MQRATRMRVVQVLASGQEIKARRAEAYGELTGEKLSDASAIRFEGMEVIEARSADEDDLLSEDGQRFRETLDGQTDPHLIEALERAIEAVEDGGTLDIHIESKNGQRTTHIRLQRNR